MATFTTSPLTAMTHESVTVDATAGGVGLTAANLVYQPTANLQYDPVLRAVEALLTLETAQIRWTVDGTAPTTTVGHLLEPGDSLVVQGYAALRAFKAIRTGGTSGTLKVTPFRR